MKCRDVERWLVLGSDERISDEEREALRAHLEGCSRCASLEAELSGLRKGFSCDGAGIAAPPAALVEQTRVLCLERLAAPAAGSIHPVERLNGALRRIPPAVWASTIGLLLLTAFILVPFFGDVLLSQPLSYASWVGLGFIVQNILMLLFSPLLVARWRRA